MRKISDKTNKKILLYAALLLGTGAFTIANKPNVVNADTIGAASTQDTSSVSNSNSGHQSSGSIVLSQASSATSSATSKTSLYKSMTTQINEATSSLADSNAPQNSASAETTGKASAATSVEQKSNQENSGNSVESKAGISQTAVTRESNNESIKNSSSVASQSNASSFSSNVNVSVASNAASISSQSATIHVNTSRAMPLFFAQDNEDDLTNDTFYFLGDSITVGQMYPQGGPTSGAIATTTYPSEFGRVIGVNSSTQINNDGHVGAMIDGGVNPDTSNTSLYFSLSNLVIQDIGKLSSQHFDVLVLAFGTNDFDFGITDLQTLENSLSKSLQRILSSWAAFNNGNDAKIYAVLPLPTFRAQQNTHISLADMMNYVGANGYSQNDLRNALTNVYQKYGITTIDWPDNLVTGDNRWQTLSDTYTHPTQDTYVAMGQNLANFVQNHLPSTETLVKPTTALEFSTPNIGYATNLVQDSNGVSSNGRRLVGLSTDTTNGRKIFFDQYGNPLRDAYDNVNQYYYGDDGFSISGFKNINGSLYFFSPDNYKKVTSQFIAANGSGYVFDDQGRAVSGLNFFNGGLYYFDPSTHLRVDNQYIQTSTGGYYFGNDGKVATGLTYAYGTWYYFDPVTHLRVDNQYIQMPWGGYYFNNGGTIATGLTYAYGTWYYFDPVTHLRVDNQYIQMAWGGYYFNNGGTIASGLTYAYGTWYYFDPSTHLRVSNQYIQMAWGGYYFNNGGTIASGLTRAYGATYYFNPQTYLRTDNEFVKLDDGIRHFNNGGVLSTGFQFIDGHWYYFDEKDGLLQKGTFAVNGKVYETDAEGRVLNY